MEKNRIEENSKRKNSQSFYFNQFKQQEKGIHGFGLSLRPNYFEALLKEDCPFFSWLEVLPDQFIPFSPFLKKNIEALSEKYPLVFHCLELSVGSLHPFDKDYLNNIKSLQKKLKPLWISDHWCWTSYEGQHFHDLLPFPYTEEMAKHLIKRITFLQDFFESPLVLENISSYFAYKMSTKTESEFLKEVMEASGCKLLLDINNLYVNAFNGHKTHPDHFLQTISKKFVKQIHLAGFTKKDNYLIDSHSKPISKEVKKLYKKALTHYGPVPTSIEWDEDFPSFNVLIEEVISLAKIL